MIHIKIGRTKPCDVVLSEDSAISREHAELFHDDEGNTFLTDLNSSNGTFINGQKLEGSAMLEKNDIVKLGNTVIPWRNYLKGQFLDEESGGLTANNSSETKAENEISEWSDTIKNEHKIWNISASVISLLVYFTPVIPWLKIKGTSMSCLDLIVKLFDLNFKPDDPNYLFMYLALTMSLLIPIGAIQNILYHTEVLKKVNNTNKLGYLGLLGTGSIIFLFLMTSFLGKEVMNSISIARIYGAMGNGVWIAFVLSLITYVINKNFYNPLFKFKSVTKTASFYAVILVCLCYFSNIFPWLENDSIFDDAPSAFVMSLAIMFEQGNIIDHWEWYGFMVVVGTHLFFIFTYMLLYNFYPVKKSSLVISATLLVLSIGVVVGYYVYNEEFNRSLVTFGPGFKLMVLGLLVILFERIYYLNTVKK